MKFQVYSTVYDVKELKPVLVGETDLSGCLSEIEKAAVMYTQERLVVISVVNGKVVRVLPGSMKFNVSSTCTSSVTV